MPPITPDQKQCCFPRRVTGQYLGGHVHLGNRRIFRVLMETHFPWSVFDGKTGFRLLSSRNDQRRRRHGPKDSILIFWKKSSTFHQKSIFHRDFTATPCRLTAAFYTPNNPPYTRDEPGTDCGRWGARFASGKPWGRSARGMSVLSQPSSIDEPRGA